MILLTWRKILVGVGILCLHGMLMIECLKFDVILLKNLLAVTFDYKFRQNISSIEKHKRKRTMAKNYWIVDLSI